MRAPLVLVLLSLGLTAWGFQPDQADFLLLALPSLFASLYLLAHTWRQPRTLGPTPAPKWIVVDGSNVMHWADGTPRLSSLRTVLDHLTKLGFSPGVVFDANAGYKIGDSYQHDGALCRLLGLPEDRVMVVAKGTPADPILLTAARDLGARVVSNDRFRDWAESYPQVNEPGHLVRGGFRDGKLWLDL